MVPPGSASRCALAHWPVLRASKVPSENPRGARSPLPTYMAAELRLCMSIKPNPAARICFSAVERVRRMFGMVLVAIIG